MFFIYYPVESTMFDMHSVVTPSDAQFCTGCAVDEPARISSDMGSLARVLEGFGTVLSGWHVKLNQRVVILKIASVTVVLTHCTPAFM
jgi:hypothetical protein